MAISFPHAPGLSCPEKSFSDIKNTRQPCTNILYKLVTNPIPVNITNGVYCPNNFICSTPESTIYGDTSGLTGEGAPMYWYINPIDLLGNFNGIVFNRIRMFFYEADAGGGGGEFTINVALYKLTDGAKLGDPTTYPTNSIKIMETAPVLINSGQEGGFKDLEFPEDFTLTAYDESSKANHYFLGMRLSSAPAVLFGGMYTSGSIEKDIAAEAIFPIRGYTYYSFLTTPLGVSMGASAPATDGRTIGQFPYYTLWKF
jgi:hypothetical protein